jgi:hypothetical protein
LVQRRPCNLGCSANVPSSQNHRGRQTREAQSIMDVIVRLLCPVETRENSRAAKRPKHLLVPALCKWSSRLARGRKEVLVVTAPSPFSHNGKPLVEPSLRIPLLLERPEPWQTLAKDLFQRLIAMSEVDVPEDTARRPVSFSCRLISRRGRLGG